MSVQAVAVLQQNIYLWVGRNCCMRILQPIAICSRRHIFGHRSRTLELVRVQVDLTCAGNVVRECEN